MQKHVIITGASGNLGRATVEKFVDKGYWVSAIDSPGRSFPFKAGEVTTYEADLSDEKSTSNIIDQVISKNKSIDAALLLAGGYASGGIKETDSASLDKMISLNFETAYHVARPIFLHMQKQTGGGRIIMIGARPAIKATDGKKSLAYALSKSLIFKFAEFLNAEGSSQNIITSVIVPSTIDTPANRESMPDADFAKWVRPEAIASLMELICSEKGSSLREPVFKIYGES